MPDLHFCYILPFWELLECRHLSIGEHFFLQAKDVRPSLCCIFAVKGYMQLTISHDRDFFKFYLIIRTALLLVLYLALKAERHN